MRIRHSNGWTQEQTSEKGKFDLRFYQRVESGRYSFNLETVARLVETFRVDVSEFFK
jgi:transcriptional regulator with XRE-family HTH domain